jgi:3'-phosphoadenosine 5'-phosphosulfate sulfotransferase (PAPS reductase)/FAD synthetase
MKEINLRPEILAAVERRAAFALSISGGKDSQAMLVSVVHWLRSIDYPNELYFAIHADLGRMEWQMTGAFCAQLCHDLGVNLVTVRREKGDLLARFQERMTQLEGTGKPFWASPKARYCTSDLKTRPIDMFLRQFSDVVNVMGIRASESVSRSKKPCIGKRESISTRGRAALDWNAILDWSTQDVWASCGNSNLDLALARNHYTKLGEIPKFWKFHPAYAMGNDRLSCALCIMGCLNDLKNGIRHNPEIATTLIEMENRSGFSFQQGRSLGNVRSLLETELKLF